MQCRYPFIIIRMCSAAKNRMLLCRKKRPALILAAKEGRLIYEGAPVCQSFGNEYFYYTSCVMNCVYNCEYCYLKGMYPSGHIVVFVNLEDIFAELEEILQKHPVYLCVSYDTDLMALEDLTGFVESWLEFVRSHARDSYLRYGRNAGRTDLWDRLKPNENAIFSFTLSPERIRRECVSTERHLLKDGSGALQGQWSMDFRCVYALIRFIHCPDWRTQYDAMLDQVRKQIDMEKVWDVSAGDSFRISQDYMKKLEAESEGLPRWYSFRL